jgi:hypothetical protein
MLAVLGDYLKHLNCEIESYEQLIAQKREEAQKLAQLQGQVVEALGILKNVVDELQTVDPEAISTIQMAALQIFENQDHNGKLPTPLPNVAPATTIESTTNENSSEASLAEAENEDSHQESHCIRLSENVVYDPEKAIVHAGINAYNRAKAWGEWLCFNHTVGTRFEVNSHSRSQSYSYDLTVYGMEREDIQRLVSCDLTKHPGSAENASWQPPKRLPQAALPGPQVCQPGDLTVDDIARKDDGREYRVVGVSEDGSIVKVVNEDEMEMAFSVGTLYLVQKHESQSDAETTSTPETDKNGKADPSSLEIGSQVVIHSSRYQGKYEGREGVVAAEPSNFGVKVDIGLDDPIFFLKDEVFLQ